MTTTQIENATVTIETNDVLPTEIPAPGAEQSAEAETAKRGRAKRRGVEQPIVARALDEVLDDTFQVKTLDAFLQIKGPNGHRLYIGQSKMVRQVDISFTPPEGLESATAPRRPNGRVESELDTEHPSFLEDLKALVTWMKTAPEQADSKPRAKFVPTLPVIAQRQLQARIDSGEAAAQDDGAEQGETASA